MACLLLNQGDFGIKIPSSDNQDGVTFYNIEVHVGGVQWSVKHRYSEFAELHDVLVTEHCVEKEILPPKKLIGNKSDSFVEKRRQCLETYLNSVYSYLKKAMPREFALFLHLHVYDIFFLLQNMALQFFTESTSADSHSFDPVQVVTGLVEFFSLKLLWIFLQFFEEEWGIILYCIFTFNTSFVRIVSEFLIFFS